jgi:probable HAF family extracellular repeat protein
MFKRLFVVLAVLIATLPLLGQTITDLGTLGGSSSGANAISNNGQFVVGSAGTPATVEYAGLYPINVHAFVYSNGVMTDLGTLGGTNSEAYAVNDQGQIAGYSWVFNPKYPSDISEQVAHAFLYSNTAMVDINEANSIVYTINGVTLSATMCTSIAFGINESGEVVGSTNLAYLGSSCANLNGMPLAGRGRNRIAQNPTPQVIDSNMQDLMDLNTKPLLPQAARVLCL